MLRKLRLTSNNLREALSNTVRALQGDKTDKEMAQEWGVKSGCVITARNKNHTIGLESFLRLGKEYGPQGVDTVLALAGLRSLSLDEAKTLDISRVPCDVAKCLPILIDRLSDGDWSDADQKAFEDAGVVHCFLNLADQMRERRDSRRLRSVE